MIDEPLDEDKTECSFCKKLAEVALIPFFGRYKGRAVCIKCLDGALTWLESFTAVSNALNSLEGG